jgi:DNA anti-recombination protein RmuC
MKIKISYTVEHDEVPGEIAKFLEQTKKEVDVVSSTIGDLRDIFSNRFELDGMQRYMQELESVRASLVKIDSVVGDCMDLTSGIGELVEHFNKMKEENSKTEAGIPEDEPSSEEVEDE